MIAELKLVLADLTQAKELLAGSSGVGGFELLVETIPKLERIIETLKPTTLESSPCPVCGGLGGMHVWRNCSGAAPQR
jgi:hypothetical protein